MALCRTAGRLEEVIPVLMPPEPSDFELRVRQQGLSFLSDQGHSPHDPPPNSRFWKVERVDIDGNLKSAEYWREAKDALQTGYSNRCVYSCFALEDQLTASGRQISSHSIDHFHPKSLSAAGLAYEWRNLRWSWNVIDNEGKGDHIIPLDPTALSSCLMQLQEDQNGDWKVVAVSGLCDTDSDLVELTIRLLGLNLRKVVIRRNQCVSDFVANVSTYDNAFMESRQPFIFRELKRLGRL